MIQARISAAVGIAALALTSAATGTELNAWPFFVGERGPAGQAESWSAGGPLGFSGPAPAPDGGTAHGLRPFFVQVEDGTTTKTDVLYPLFYLRRYPESYRWSVLQLINGSGSADYLSRDVPADRHFDVWPFYFSVQAQNPADSYRALLPIYGTVYYRLGYRRLSWVLFPLYAQSVKARTTTTYAPFPFVRSYSGEQNGFALWPLFGSTRGPGGARHSFYLWPFAWDNVVAPDPDGPEGAPMGTQFGILPFYTRETAGGLVTVNYAWPFFGYTERTFPYRYSERRYFWPFVVEGRGVDHSLTRWAPFYSRSEIRGQVSTWIGWPFWHNTSWTDGDRAQSKTQFFYFAYWSLEQSDLTRPAAAHARKTHIWPFVSFWDNGAGSMQFQFPSPVEVFFPDNPDMRETWSPLFSVLRYSRRPEGDNRTSVLWDAITWTRDKSGSLKELHVGPLLAMRSRPGGPGWSILGFDLSGRLGKVEGAIR